MEIYKGYLKGNGKHTATSFKDSSKLLSYNTVRLVDSYVGILEDDFIYGWCGWYRGGRNTTRHSRK